MSIATRTMQVIADQAGCNISQATLDKRLTEDLGLDSLDRYELTLALEDEFGNITITDEESGHLITVGEIVGLMERKMAGAAL